MMRPSIDAYMMTLAVVASMRATCSRRAVGCILVNQHNYVIATGYNGVPKGLPHCSDEMCPGRRAESGQSLDLCCATHAEQNALLQVRDAQSITTVYCTTQPCLTCTKLLLNTSCQRIVYLHPYVHHMAEDMWKSAGRSIERLSDESLHEMQKTFNACATGGRYHEA